MIVIIIVLSALVGFLLGVILTFMVGAAIGKMIQKGALKLKDKTDYNKVDE